MVELISIDDKVEGPAGTVYSTSPRVARGTDGSVYFVKGCDSVEAFAEVAGCRIARALGLDVPKAEVGIFNGGYYAAVEEVKNCQRNVQRWIENGWHRKEWHHIYSTIVVDLWLVNDDRNMGNMVAVPDGNRTWNVVFLDFEKSVALRPQPTVSSPLVPIRKLWPRGELGSELSKSKGLSPPSVILNTIKNLPKAKLTEIVSGVAAELPFVDWHDDSVAALDSRARKIDELAVELWESK